MEHIIVKIDMREDDLWKALEPWHSGSGSGSSGGDGWSAERVTLDVGDIAFCGPSGTELMLLERKTAEDLGASQRDGRYREQRARLLAKRGGGTPVAYVLEFPTWSVGLTRSWCRGVFQEIHLQNAILRLQMRYTIPVFQSTSLKETVMWIRRIATALVADETAFSGGLAATRAEASLAYNEALHVKKAGNMQGERVLSSMLRTIPGVGKSAAEAIVGYCEGSFTRFHQLTAPEISAIKMGVGSGRKIGSALAEKIWNIFHDGTKSTVEQADAVNYII
jgi:ERCC4-type nuclease